MLITQFILENLHFGLNVFTALVFFAVAWLYLDAYFLQKSKKEIVKIIGFSLLSISFLVHATLIEQASLNNSLFSGSLVDTVSNLIKFISYIVLIAALIIDPIEKKPVYATETKDQTPQEPPKVGDKTVKVVAGFALPSSVNLVWLVAFPFLSLIIFILYLRKSTIGLERHLKPLTIGFFFIFLYELFSLAKLLEASNAISIYNIVKPFAPLWILTHVFLLIGIVIIAKWVFQYLLKRLQTELFMIMNTCILIIFLITTLFFTGLLLKSLQDDALSHLITDVNVVQYAINSKKAQTLSDAELVSQNTDIKNAILINDRQKLQVLSTSILIAKKQAFLIIIGKSGAVLMRGEDNEKVGDSMSSDSLFIRAVRGEKASSVIIKDGAIAPTASIRSGVPVIQGKEIIGVVIVGTDIDNAFVDGLKTSTKLDVSVYSGNTLSATTFVGADGKSRFVGVKEENSNVKKNVLIEGKNYSTEISILNVPYFAAFAPLKDVDSNPVGMLFVGKEQVSVIQAASKSIEYTFIIAAILILLSIIPSFLISRFIANQMK